MKYKLITDMKSKIRIFGFAVALSYLIVILYVWANAEYSGHVYFLAGEPNRVILYAEWILGFIAIAIIANEFIRCLIEAKAKVIYDPLV